MRAWETNTWEKGILEEEVIARVGQRLGEKLMAVSRPGDNLLMLAGKGHNGDDVRAACPWISRRNLKLINVRHPEEQLNALQQALSESPDFIVEGLFGIGLNRPLEGAWAEVVRHVNASEAVTISVDIPSGLDVNTGKPLGTTIEANETWTVGAVKSGMLASGASKYVGRIEVISDVGLIDLPDHGTEIYFGEDSDFSFHPSISPLESHKGTYGCTMIFAGSRGYHGAAVLAARGASRARPGLVELSTHESAYQPVASQLQNVMVFPVKNHLLIPPKATSIVMGPGLASDEIPRALRSQVAEVWESFPAPVIIDASALDWLPATGGPKSALRVITPHPGEAARMLGVETTAIQADRPTALRRLSEKYGNCLVVLKGHQTLIGDASSPIYVNPSGNPTLAQGGTGDILAGFLGGLMAQQRFNQNPLLTLRYGVWMHGRAADLCGNHSQAWSFDRLLESM